jgi:hypothetical protein
VRDPDGTPRVVINAECRLPAQRLDMGITALRRAPVDKRSPPMDKAEDAAPNAAQMISRHEAGRPRTRAYRHGSARVVYEVVAVALGCHTQTCHGAFNTGHRLDRRLFRPRDCSDLAIVPTSRLFRRRRGFPCATRSFRLVRSEQSSLLARTVASRAADIIERVEPSPDGPCRRGKPHESPYTAGHPRDRARGRLTNTPRRSRPADLTLRRSQPAATDSDCSDLSGRNSLPVPAVQRPGRNNREVGTIGVVPTSEQRRF